MDTFTRIFNYSEGCLIFYNQNYPYFKIKLNSICMYKIRQLQPKVENLFIIKKCRETQRIMKINYLINIHYICLLMSSLVIDWSPTQTLYPSHHLCSTSIIERDAQESLQVYLNWVFSMYIAYIPCCGKKLREFQENCGNFWILSKLGNWKS